MRCPGTARSPRAWACRRRTRRSCAARSGCAWRFLRGRCGNAGAGWSWAPPPFLRLVKPVDEAGEQAADFRRGGCRGEQESEDEGDDRVPRTKPHVAVGDEDENSEDDDERNGYGHCGLISFRCGSGRVSCWCA